MTYTAPTCSLNEEISLGIIYVNRAASNDYLDLLIKVSIISSTDHLVFNNHHHKFPEPKVIQIFFFCHLWEWLYLPYLVKCFTFHQTHLSKSPKIARHDHMKKMH